MILIKKTVTVELSAEELTVLNEYLTIVREAKRDIKKSITIEIKYQKSLSNRNLVKLEQLQSKSIELDESKLKKANRILDSFKFSENILTVSSDGCLFSFYMDKDIVYEAAKFYADNFSLNQLIKHLNKLLLE